MSETGEVRVRGRLIELDTSRREVAVAVAVAIRTSLSADDRKT